MATVIKIKKSTGSTAPTALGNGELGYTQAAGTQANGGYRLYLGAGTESSGEADHIDVVGGKYFTDMLDHAHGTLTASSAIIADSNSKVSQMIIDNIDINSNTISTTDTNGDLIISPHGSGDVDVNSSKIINLTDPTAAQDAATKAYVDAVSSGLDVKGSCVLGTTAALPTCTYANGSSGVGATLTGDSNGALTVDGVAVVAADRILVKNQAAGAQNGIYTVSATGSGSAAFVLTRATDADTATEFNSGAFVFVEKGTANADNGYVMTQDTTITFGSTSITFDQFSGAGQITAGDALTKSGNTMNVAVDDSSIEVSSDALRIKTNWIGQGSITTLGTIGTGVWQGTAVGTQYGGTGQNFSSSTGVISLSSGTASVSATLPVSLGGTGASTAAAGATALGVGTGDSPEFTAVNVGHATDTTVARASAGDISVEGNIVYRAGGTDVPVADGGTGLSSIAKGSLLVANTINTLTALDGGGSDDGVAFYTASTDTISWATSLDGGTF